MRHKAAIKMKGLVKPAKAKPSVGQKKEKVQPKNDSGTARNVQDKSVRGKRKKAFNNNRMDVVHQEALGLKNKISPTKKRKLDPFNVVTPSASQLKKIPVEVREEEKETFKMSKEKENLRLYKQVYINVTRLDKSSLNEANISIFSSIRKEIVAKKMKEDIETDQLKDEPNIENSEKILKLEQIIDKLKSQNVTLHDENKSKNEALNSVIKEKEEYIEKCVNEGQKYTTMLKSANEEVEARKNRIDRLVSEKEALEAEIKNKDKTLNLVSKDKDEVSLKSKEAREKLICQVQFNQGLIEEVVGLKNAVNSMKADHNLQNTTIEELKAHAKGLTLSNNQMSQKVANLTKHLDLKDLQTQNFAKQLEEVNKRAESLAKLYEEKRKEVEILIKFNEEKDQEEDNIFKKSEEQIEELGLLWRQFKQKTCEVEMLLNQTQEKQKQLKSVTRQNEEKSEEIENITKHLKDKSQELEGLDSERALLETSFNEKEIESDSTLQKCVNSQEARRIVNENTAEKVKEFQKKFDEEKEKNVNKAKKDLDEIQNLKAKLITVKTHFQNTGNQSPSEDQLSQSKTDLAHFQEEAGSFHGTRSSVKESTPFAQANSSGICRITENLNDQTKYFPDDDNAPNGPASLARSEHLGEIASEPLGLSLSEHLGEIASEPLGLLRSEHLGEIASELRDEVMQLLPPIQEKEGEDKRMIGNAQQILQDVIEYRKNLEDIKKKFSARLSQVSKPFAVKNN